MSVTPTSTNERFRIPWLPWCVLGLVMLWLVWALGATLSPAIASLLLAYFLAGPTNRLERLGLPRALAVVFVMMATLAAATCAVLIILPILQKEIELLRAQLPDLLARISDSVLPWLEKKLGVRVRMDAPTLRAWLTRQWSEGGGDIAAWVFDSAKLGGAAALEWIGVVLLVPILLFYILLDWHPLCQSTMALVPARWRAGLSEALQELNAMVSGWLQGVGLLTISLAIFYAGALWLANFELWWPLGLLTGLLMFIPYLGFALALVLALVAGMLQFGPLEGLWRIALIYALGQAIESWWLTPKLVGERIGLHPVTVIVALLIFGALFGFFGVLLALPFAAAAIVIMRRLKVAWLRSSYFLRPGGTDS